ncbi:MAG: sugar phosphate isomerase/epimerase family protein [Chthonomonadales bacterium]
MRIACCAYSYREELQNGSMTLEDFLDTIAKVGFDAAELTAYYFPTTDRSYLNHIKRNVHELGLTVSGTAVGSDFTQPDAAARRSHIQMTKDWIRHSVVLGAPTLRVFAGPIREGVTEEQSFRWCVECLQECASAAEQEGVILALENHGGLTANAEGTLRLLGAVGSDWLRLNLDFGNFVGDVYGQFERCAPYAAATHAKVHYNGPSGREAVDYMRVRTILEGAGYHGYIAMEYEEPEPAATGVPKFAETLFRAFRG